MYSVPWLREFRRIASYIYQKNQRWKQSVELAKKDGLFKAGAYTRPLSSSA
jgi:hypothetical protein